MRSRTPYFNQNYARHLYTRGYGTRGFGRFAKVAIVGTGVYFVSKKLFYQWHARLQNPQLNVA
ncbi:uncharacterized protein BO88DRAFT_401973 [Aspergillus vadensis CBS 113365]|uniref:Uncharacterized protein n=1 Tax=Aspergillus vadensis (strain CBS 113365 / IMI 142717 / IBT 24658) TaxID=1448311 RepID=A0A319BP33_ASPVC|nr:hypothetical protein BO88DRAFT_401973 [Aspergillus vadensis CBS 113365]PYH72900.1 hypothetical protein BO88DRAFT_401973 [Aspergillus vadensis CBS 113365]